jgi:L-lysine exporter family protein LysE/ArgO
MLSFSPALAFAPAFNAGLLLSLSLIMALGPQNAHVMRMGLRGQHVWLTVAVCIVSDVLLIGLGVLGIAYVGGMSEGVRVGLVLAGIAFLIYYGAQAFVRCRNGESGALPDIQVDHSAGRMTRRQATASALAFGWLNPHAWLDTAVLIGTASIAWGTPGNAVFGLGAAAGSVIWFLGLGLSLFWLGQRLRSPQVWRVLDGLVALMMWGTALTLGWGLLGL